MKGLLVDFFEVVFIKNAFYQKWISFMLGHPVPFQSVTTLVQILTKMATIGQDSGSKLFDDITH